MRASRFYLRAITRELSGRVASICRQLGAVPRLFRYSAPQMGVKGVSRVHAASRRVASQAESRPINENERPRGRGARGSCVERVGGDGTKFADKQNYSSFPGGEGDRGNNFLGIWGRGEAAVTPSSRGIVTMSWRDVCDRG